MQKPSNLLASLKTQPRWRIGAAAVLAVALGLLWLRSGGGPATRGATFAARRGPLDITVLEGGSIQALQSQELKCEVRVGYQGTKILKIIDEGYQVTEQDVRTNKVLVELDSSDLEKQLVQQEIQFQTAAASLTDAQQGYEIQVNQNLSDVQAAQQDARFARMDFDKFLGDSVTQEVVDQIGLEKELAAEAASVVRETDASASAAPMARTNSGPVVASGPASDPPKVIELGGTAEKPPLPAPTGQSVPAILAANPKPQKAPGGASSEPTSQTNEPPHTIRFDFSKYAKIEALGDGEAKQKVRKFDDDLQVAKKELGQAQSTLEGTQRLFDKGFVTKIDLERDEIAYENARLKVQTAETARDLFLKYEFRRSAEDALSKYVEAARKLDRASKAAVAKLAQAEAKLKSAQGQYNIALRGRTDLNDQLAKCTIRAGKPGLAVYGGAQDMFYYGPQEQIREGATIRERQTIITIPDMTRMSVKVKIHESYIKKIRKGQKVRITVDAFPDQLLEGEVTNVGVLPDSQNRWMNPDLKVYLTTITINGTYDWIKPGMSAKAEILVDHLDDVVHVPIQSVTPSASKQVCYVLSGLKPEKREVEVGQFNDAFIEIKKGLKEGDKVLLHPPESGEPETSEQKPIEKGKEKPPQPSPPGEEGPKPEGQPATAKPLPASKA